MAAPPAIAVVAVIVVLLITIIVVLIRKKRSKEDFAPGDAATPKIRGLVADVEESLIDLSSAADSARAHAAWLDAEYGHVRTNDDSDRSRALVNSVLQASTGITDSVEALRRNLARSPNTYHTALSLYRGLRDSDRGFNAAARAFDQAAAQVNAVLESSDGYRLAPEHEEDLKIHLRESAGMLERMGSYTRNLVRSVHYLGSGLQLE